MNCAVSRWRGPRLSDGSTLLTILVLALSLPLMSPWWMMVMAAAFVIIIAKQLYSWLRLTSTRLSFINLWLSSTCSLLLLSAMRKLLGNGTLFDGADQLLGGWTRVLRIEVFHTDAPFCWRCCRRSVYWPVVYVSEKIPY